MFLKHPLYLSKGAVAVEAVGPVYVCSACVCVYEGNAKESERLKESCVQRRSGGLEKKEAEGEGEVQGVVRATRGGWFYKKGG